MRKIEVLSVVIGALGTVSKYFEKWIEKLDLDLTIETLQKPRLLGTAIILLTNNNINNAVFVVSHEKLVAH